VNSGFPASVAQMEILLPSHPVIPFFIVSVFVETVGNYVGGVGALVLFALSMICGNFDPPN
jgi:hypothetical protein